MANWDLFREMDSLRREIDHAFRGFGGSRLFEPTFLPGLGARPFPRINLTQDKDNYYVEALIPGIDVKELEMTLQKGTLTLSGERKDSPASEQAKVWHRRERGVGSFLRTVELPGEIDSAKVTAEYREGILLVTLPKREEAKPKKIDVRIH